MANEFNKLAEEAAIYHSRLKKHVSDGLIILHLLRYHPVELPI